MKKIFIIFSVLLLIAGCSVFRSAPDVVMPLNNGNEWSYEKVDFRSNGDTNYSTYKMVVESDTLINGEKWYYITSPTDYLSLVMFYKNKEDGFYYRGDNFEESRLVLKYPVEKGERIPLYEFEQVIVDIDLEVTTPAGTFNCIKYKIRAEDFTDYMYAEPGVGVVKIESVREDGTLRERTVLTEYTINN